MDIGNIIDAAFSNAFGPQAIVFALAAIGLNIHFGYTGLLNFGQAGFMAVGAYGLAVTMVQLDLPLPVGIAAGLFAALLLALVLGVPTLRLRADYLAIVTIAAAEILRLVFGAVETKKVFGGSNGLNGFTQTWNDLNPYSSGVDLGFASWGRNDLWAMTAGWVAVALCCLLTWALMRSPWGRVLRSIREDEDAVRSLGKNVFLYKMQALMLGGVIGGLGGIFFALKQGSVVPSDYSTNLTFFAYTALLIGGAARVLGPVVGSMIFWFLISGLGEFFSQATRGIDPLIPASVMTDTQASLIRYILMGLGLMLLMIYRPQGIFGDRREIALDDR
ncbi:branched-chain amino acid ABC transporter permease [Aeromicrobium sp. 636]|uniref:Branched-chain amino acid ABC transporter permease n=1 Tax=Aeromicrobium senzhongii TaxID=2663859 RepID=A0A8I0ESW5_9ACTN|nr:MULTISPECIES: branched-chain amino acid ABC transporter permease [Aeromicrobium]MBC9224818.1 branched-chain amino acid ABC transporter permease [Aeromicrobium senzhongii]MCQ3996931.1 branched-chain amino acid ABC transporter permease [Aeromicrobium sp. 636]MTB86865.1 branched-chain amino acid ABC transporter permease [Aeromicrobium senzhongii]QNL93300.1 branched-chain amino acid ABC transporter permease [Aeromicrobium senzhongii]